MIKICGLRTAGDVEVCAALGVPAIGLNFVPGSVRLLSVADAVLLADAAAGRCCRVGVFSNQDRSAVDAVLAKVKLDALQFHGDETAEFCRSFDRPYVKVIGVEAGGGSTVGADTEQQVGDAVDRYPDASGLLLDTHAAGRSGGTGKAFDWSLWPRHSAPMPLYLAGGLTPDNVQQAIAATRCAGVDVASGVDGPVRGVKSADRIRAFVAAAQGARTALANRQAGT